MRRVPTKIKAIAYIDGGASPSGDGDVRIWDQTNSQVICEKLTIGPGKAIHDLGTLLNLPAAEAKFEIQSRMTPGSITALVVEDARIYFN